MEAWQRVVLLVIIMIFLMSYVAVYFPVQNDITMLLIEAIIFMAMMGIIIISLRGR